MRDKGQYLLQGQSLDMGEFLFVRDSGGNILHFMTVVGNGSLVCFQGGPQWPISSTTQSWNYNFNYPEGNYVLIMQADGSCAVFSGTSTQHDATSLYSSSTNPAGGSCFASLDSDGTLRYYQGTPDQPGPSYSTSEVEFKKIPITKGKETKHEESKKVLIKPTIPSLGDNSTGLMPKPNSRGSSKSAIPSNDSKTPAKK